MTPPGVMDHGLRIEEALREATLVDGLKEGMYNLLQEDVLQAILRHFLSFEVATKKPEIAFVAIIKMKFFPQ